MKQDHEVETATSGDHIDLVEWYFQQGWTDGLPVVPPTPATVAAMVEALGGDAERLETRVPPRWGNLTREVLAINLVLAGCLPSYAPVVRAAILALCSPHFNLNGIQATTHMAAPLLVVNGPVRGEIGMNAGANVFGSGTRANATIGSAVRLVLLNVGGAWPGDLDKSTLGPPRQVHLLHRRERSSEPLGPVSRGTGLPARRQHGVLHRDRGATQCHQPPGERPAGGARQHRLGDEHHRPQQRRQQRVMRRGHRTGTRRDHRRPRLDAQRRPALPLVAHDEHLRRHQLQRPLRHDLQPESAEVVSTRTRRADPDRAVARRHSPVRRRRRGGPVLRVSPRLGTHDVARCYGRSTGGPQQVESAAWTAPASCERRRLFRLQATGFGRSREPISL